MESLKTLVNALRALFDGVDGKLANVQKGLAKVWDWINGLAWVARSETIERLPETTVHFEGTSSSGNEYTLEAPLPDIDISGLSTGDTVIVWKDGTPLRCGVFAEKIGLVECNWLICYPPTMQPLVAIFQSEFFIASSGAACYVYMGFPSGEVNEDHTFAIKPETMPEAKLESAFVDARWSAGGGAARIEAMMSYTDTGLYNIFTAVLTLGQTYTLVVDGTAYYDVAKALADGTVYIGNPHIVDETQADNGLEFYIENGSADIIVNGLTEGQKYFVGLYEGIVEQLPSRYAPAAVFEKIEAGAMAKSNPTGTGYLSLNRKGGTTPGAYSVTEGGYCDASGDYSHAEGCRTIAASNYQHVQGRYNVADSAWKYAHIVGGGLSDDTRENIHTLDWNGSAWFAGEVYVGSTSGNDMDDGSVKLLKDGGSGDGSNLTAAYTVPETRAALTSGEKLSAALGKVSKWLGDLGGLAFKSTVAKSDLDEALQTQLTDLDEDVARYKGGQLTTIAGVAIPTGGGGGGGGDVVVDTALNSTSTNPVQNAAIYAALDEKAPKTHDHSADDIKAGTLPIERGGTGAVNAAGARTNLDVYSKSEVDDAITNAIGDAIAASY